jgi:hypothetical protein
MSSNKIVLGVCCALVLALCGCSRQQSDWQKARETNTTDSYEQFLKKYPTGEFTSQAQARVKELYEERDWQKARDLDTPEAYQAFLKQYPEGKWTEEARIRVENFTLAQAPSGGGAGGAADSSTPSAAGAAIPTADRAGCQARGEIRDSSRRQGVRRSLCRAIGSVQIGRRGGTRTLGAAAERVPFGAGRPVLQGVAEENLIGQPLPIAGHRFD